ncbi:cilia- and flagella-associated protein 410 [Leptidea sinapis]|uniref:cilia- and flagella-associated protein 410 n=1 Tax=Leptidea sinapis TaxID=189913 RepID=UPI00214057E8|nr:cilia- and flagella-associated protein 410 [Leptidea sinapis]
MARLTEEMVIARTKQSELSVIKNLNCWGAELGDVSLLRQMPNVEVLAFSINKLRGLEVFASCRRLRELYVRKNEIRDLAEIRHLKHLPDLTSLWLDENPCSRHPEYRLTVLRNLPHLEKLDNISVQPDEVQEAMRRGTLISDSDDEGFPHQESYGAECGGSRSCESSPEREPEPEHEPRGRLTHRRCTSPPACECPSPPACVSPSPPPSPVQYRERAGYDRDHVMSASHYEARRPRSPDVPSLRHSVSAHSVKEYCTISNGDWRSSVDAEPSRPAYDAPSAAPVADRSDRSDRSECYNRGDWERPERDIRDVRARDIPSAVWGARRRRPVARNSNLLSAVLCLVKELDYPSLEVAEMAVRCRMDELAEEQ